MKPGGTLVVNSTLVPQTAEPDEGVRQINVPLHGVCKDLGNTKVISTVALAPWRSCSPICSRIRRRSWSSPCCQLAKKPELAELNKRAFAAGSEAMKKSLA